MEQTEYPDTNIEDLLIDWIHMVVFVFGIALPMWWFAGSMCKIILGIMIPTIALGAITVQMYKVMACNTPLQNHVRDLETTLGTAREHIRDLQSQLVQMELDNEQLRALVALINNDQEFSFHVAKTNITTLETQNSWLIEELNALQRQLSAPEEARWGFRHDYELSLRGYDHVKKLIKENICAGNQYGQQHSIKNASTKRNIVTHDSSTPDRSCSTHIDTVSTTSFTSSQNFSPQASERHSPDRFALYNTGHKPDTARAASRNVTQTEEVIRKRVCRLLNLAFQICRLRGMFQDDLENGHGDSEKPVRVDSAAGAEMVMDVAA
ncbi:hypothetical protein N0V90_007322 [Kalmusia sp. IMI 367209]|nr:hypothetical protein N0V90_007322 [Kalmusia sp. IMI 367209]